VPFVDGDLAGDDRRSAAIAFFEDFEEVVTSDAVEGLETPVVENEQLNAAERPLDARTWHASRDDDFLSPIVRGRARTKPKERARDRVLSDVELRAIWRSAAHRRFSRSAADCAL
jgi:hypothetical protein